VVLIPHGVIDHAPLDSRAVRSLLGLSRFKPVIGTFGFLMPGKGLPELIYAFALTLRTHPNALLLMINADYPSEPKFYVSGDERDRCLALIGHLGVKDHVILMNEFLKTEEALLALSACDIIVYPYQYSDESASGAVRLGLAAGRPLATTPLSIFSDMAQTTYQLPGVSAADIAQGVGMLLGDEDLRREVLDRQRAWVRNNSWATQATRIGNIIRGNFEDAKEVELILPAAVDMAPSIDRHAEPILEAPNLGEFARPLAMLERSLAEPRFSRSFEHDEPPREAHQTTAAMHAGVSPKKRNPVPLIDGSALRFIGNRLRRLAAKVARTSPLSLADEARDARDWRTAARYYHKFLEENPNSVDIWVQYGHALKESGNIAEAEHAYRKSLALDETIADTHLQLGHALKTLGRREEAEGAYLRALRLDGSLRHAETELVHLGWTADRIRRALRT
jgi:tetratricopeptide (TPR) repeat protein